MSEAARSELPDQLPAGIGGRIRVEEFDGHLTVEQPVFGQPDRALAAAGDFVFENKSVDAFHGSLPGSCRFHLLTY